MTKPAETVLPVLLRRRTALIVGAVCWLGFAMIAWAASAGSTAAIDKAGLLFWHSGGLPPAAVPRGLEMVRDITALGGTLLRNLFALGAVAALLFLHRKRDAALFTLTVASGWIVDAGLKALIGRARPDILPHLTQASGHSFPSGHSFNAAVIYIGMALIFAALSRRAGVRLTIIASAMALSMTIAWSRVWLGVHWPSDVLAGWLGGTGWAFLASALLYPRR